MTTQRIHRVAEAIRQVVAQILQRELKDPRIGFVTVTRVKVTADLQHATVYFSLFPRKVDPPSAGEDLSALAETEAGLKSAVGYIRRLIGDRLRLRVTPEIVFRRDPSISESVRLGKILDDLKHPT